VVHQSFVFGPGQTVLNVALNQVKGWHAEHRFDFLSNRHCNVHWLQHTRSALTCQYNFSGYITRDVVFGGYAVRTIANVNLTELIFDLDAGLACLDFANHLSSASAYADLVAFAAQSELITRADADWLHATAERDAAGAQAVLQRAQQLREAVYAIFSATAAGETPSADEVDALNDELARSLSHSRVVETETGYAWGWSGRSLDAPLWGISRQAADLLTSPSELRRVRECGGDGCHWLFMDTSKNRSRQWCSMQSCGNRQKARRHYERVRKASRSTSATNTGSTS
jgi:predicted RNA-binding Zn ribbon-like protein